MLKFITGNKNKFSEAKNILNCNIEQIDLDLVEIQELDAREVVKHKLNEAVKQTGNSEFIVEDTSLYLEALSSNDNDDNNNQMPGPLIKWFLKTLGSYGIYELTNKYNNFNATAVTQIGYIKDSKIMFFEGKIKGKIVKPIGTNGFGWDSIFMPNDEINKTYAEMSSVEKEKFSMRKIAFEKLNNYLLEN